MSAKPTGWSKNLVWGCFQMEPRDAVVREVCGAQASIQQKSTTLIWGLAPIYLHVVPPLSRSQAIHGLTQTGVSSESRNRSRPKQCFGLLNSFHSESSNPSMDRWRRCWSREWVMKEDVLHVFGDSPAGAGDVFFYYQTASCGCLFMNEQFCIPHCIPKIYTYTVWWSSNVTVLLSMNVRSGLTKREGGK